MRTVVLRAGLSLDDIDSFIYHTSHLISIFSIFFSHLTYFFPSLIFLVSQKFPHSLFFTPSRPPQFRVFFSTFVTIVGKQKLAASYACRIGPNHDLDVNANSNCCLPYPLLPPQPLLACKITVNDLPYHALRHFVIISKIVHQSIII